MENRRNTFFSIWALFSRTKKEHYGNYNMGLSLASIVTGGWDENDNISKIILKFLCIKQKKICTEVFIRFERRKMKHVFRL